MDIPIFLAYTRVTLRRTIRGDQHNLTLAPLSMNKFCVALGGLVNWNKSKGFWIGTQKDSLVWALDICFV